MRTRCHTADSCGALSRTANLLGVIHGHRDAKVGAQSVWLLTAQRQQRIKAPEADTLNTMINPKRCVSLFPDAFFLPHHRAGAKALLPAITWPKFHLSLRGAGRLSCVTGSGCLQVCVFDDGRR